MEQVRAFIAIELPGELKRALTALQERLRSGQTPAARWVDSEGIHLTLKFLGNIDAGKVGEVSAALEEAARGIPSFQLEAAGLGVFPNIKRTQVVWVGIKGQTDRLDHLQHRIEDSLASLGFPREGRRFTPHLTLARVRDRATPGEREALGQLISAASFGGGHTIDVGSVQLMRSQLSREGAIYSRLISVKLQ
jgi:2'-5' RNA ligase